MTHRFSILSPLEPVNGFRRALALDRGGVPRAVVVAFVPDVIADDPQRLAALVRDVEAAGRLHHPGAVPVIGTETVGDALAVVEQFRPGATLRALVASGGRLPPDVAARTVVDACAAIAAAHALDAGDGRPLVHSALDSARVAVGEDGVGAVSGFALAGAAGDPVADVRALAAILHECLTGEPPSDPPRAIDAPGIAPALAAVVAQGLGVAGAAPFENAAALAEAITAAGPLASHAAAGAYAEAILPAGEVRRAELFAALEGVPTDGDHAEEVSEDLIVEPSGAAHPAAPGQAASEPSPGIAKAEAPPAPGAPQAGGAPPAAPPASSAPAAPAAPPAPDAAAAVPPAPDSAAAAAAPPSGPAPSAPPGGAAALPTPPSAAQASDSGPAGSGATPGPAAPPLAPPHPASSEPLASARPAPDAATTFPAPTPARRRSRAPLVIAIAALCAVAGFGGGFVASRVAPTVIGAPPPPSVAAAPDAAAPDAAAPEARPAGPAAPTPAPAPQHRGAMAAAPDAPPRAAPKPARRAPSAATRGHGLLDVTAPAEAEVFLDGRRIGKGNVKTEVPEGIHRIEVRLGVSRVAERFTLAAGETWTYAVTPTPGSPAQ